MKRSALLPALLLCLGLLSGCGGQPAAEYPELTAPELSAYELESTQNSTVKVSFPKGEWIAEPFTDPLTIYYADTLEEERCVNINIQKGGDSATISESYREALLEALTQETPFLHVQRSEILSLNGQPVIYFEDSVVIDDAAIDFMIENGFWTEEWIDLQGGREAFQSAIPETDSLMLYAATGGQMYIYIGSYYLPEQKSAVLETMLILAQTTESPQ